MIGGRVDEFQGNGENAEPNQSPKCTVQLLKESWNIPPKNDCQKFVKQNINLNSTSERFSRIVLPGMFISKRH